MTQLLIFPETRYVKRAVRTLPGSTAGYLRDHNSGEEITFEVSKPILKVKTVQVISEATRQKLSAASKQRWMKTKAVTAARKMIALAQQDADQIQAG